MTTHLGPIAEAAIQARYAALDLLKGVWIRNDKT